MIAFETTNKVEINIRKSKIKSIHLSFDDDKIDISCSVELLTQGDKAITSVDFATYSYNENKKINTDDIPVEVYHAIGSIVSALRPIVQRKANGIEKLIEA